MIGDKIKTARKKKDYTLKDLEKITGINNGVLSTYENGVMPGAAAIIKICKALDISADWLLLDKENITDNIKEIELLDIYRLLSDDNKIVGKYKLKELLKDQNSEIPYVKAENL